MSRSQVTAFTESTWRERDRQAMKLSQIKIKTTYSPCSINRELCYQPREEDAFDDHKVLHENIPLCLLAQAANCVSDAQLDGPF